jgi:two-component system OmpR family response regulator
MARILTIEDDPVTAREIVAELQPYGNEVECVSDGRTGLDHALRGNYDAITLDRMLPGLDGLAVVTELRRAGIDTPVLMISALSDVDARVRGLRAGGDDYLTKPFAPEEMAARIEVMLRHRRTSAPETVLRVGDLQLDLIARTAQRDVTTLELLPIEFRLLEYLMRNAGQVLTRTMIFEAVWGYHFDPGTNVIDVHIGRLRRKVDTHGTRPLIQTVRGCGRSVRRLNFAAPPVFAALLFLLLFGAASLALFGFLYCQTRGYLVGRVELVRTRANRLPCSGQRRLARAPRGPCDRRPGSGASIHIVRSCGARIGGIFLSLLQALWRTCPGTGRSISWCAVAMRTCGRGLAHRMPTQATCSRLPRT